MPLDFNSPYRLKVHNVDLKDRPFEVIEPIVFVSESGRTIIVPEGYRSDFASIPRVFHRIINPVGRHGKATIVHDWLCDESPHSCSSTEAAEIFGEAMTALGVSSTRRKIMVRAVKMGGPKFKQDDL
jgi:hypothetical protein